MKQDLRNILNPLLNKKFAEDLLPNPELQEEENLKWYFLTPYSVTLLEPISASDVLTPEAAI